MSANALFAMVGTVLLVAPVTYGEDLDAVRSQIAHVDRRVDSLRSELVSQADSIHGLTRAFDDFGNQVNAALVKAFNELGARAQSAAFLAAPPPSSDLVGVAKTAVFLPRVEPDGARRFEPVTLKVRRIDAEGSQLIGEVTLLSEDPSGISLPIDQNGALYVVDWSTGDGYTYGLLLRDGLTGQTAATVQVRPYQNHGEFVFVGFQILRGQPAHN